MNLNLTDELRKLAELHQEGHLTEREFTEGKRQLLETPLVLPAAGDEGEDGGGGDAVQVDEATYQSSRWSAGNCFFPDRLTLSSDGMLFRKGAMFGSTEERINYRAIASFRVKHGIFLSEVCIETSGGQDPIVLNGLWKSAARRLQNSLRTCQRNG